MGLEKINTFVLDMDGTVYVGEKVIPGAVDFVKNVRANGKKIVFFTNNASRNKEIYFERLNKMGFQAEMSEIVSSGDVTADYLSKVYPGEKVFVLGTPALKKTFTDHNIPLTDGLDAQIVCTSFDTTLTYAALETACRLISSGAIYISTHEDINCPTEYGAMPDSGAINAAITASTGKAPKYLGKPHKETADMIASLAHTSLDSIAVVGDRLYTDIALGTRNGITSILVLTGEAKEEDITPDNVPDFVFSSIAEINNSLLDNTNMQ